jgi:hypothetical protein
MSFSLLIILYFCFWCHNTPWTVQSFFSKHSLSYLTYLPNLPKLT